MTTKAASTKKSTPKPATTIPPTTTITTAASTKTTTSLRTILLREQNGSKFPQVDDNSSVPALVNKSIFSIYDHDAVKISIQKKKQFQQKTHTKKGN